jgi:predicted ATPase/DNA-binding SARP family transcriptional activator/tetratricopeptide (TPR) repeat protein
VDQVRFRLLGPMEMSVGGKPAKLPGAAERALMAQLLLAPGRTIPATLLVDRLWSESTLPVDPMNALQIRVSKLRRALTSIGLADVVGREGVGYRADVDPSQVDALEFERRLREARAEDRADSDGNAVEQLERYDAALSLWSGEPLSDFATEQWAMAEAARLSELKLAAMTERAQIALAAGRHAEVVAQLDPIVSADPKLESMAGLLMVALYRSGRQADALEVFARTRDVLDEELGLEPSLTLRSLHERVLRQDASLGGQTDLAPPAVVMPTTRSRAGDTIRATNLPTVVRPLIGRDEQLDGLVSLIGETRLLSLIGPGGAGKTSLALATAVRTADDYPDGAFGVRLASVNEPDQVPVAVADALSVPLDGAAGDRDVRERLINFLARKNLLLLVDNCEHVIDAVAALLDDVLGRCPDVTVLTTSREALAVPDEVQVTVGPLETPPELGAPGGVLDYPAAQLFADRARAVRPGTVFGEQELRAIGRICRSLDGIPLAIELAAARTVAMSPSDIAGRLDQRFALLTSGARTAEARQQTLRATVDWSYALLSETEQRVFNRLSVFQGGWTLTAAEHVVADPAMRPGEVLDVVGRLVERSMVVVEPGPTTRYRMLETLRQYAAEQLAETGESEELARRHAAYFRSLALESEMGLRGHGQRAALEVLRADQPNLRAAMAWLGGSGGDPDAALSMAGSLGLFWHLGRHLEGREVLAGLLAVHTGTPMARAAALQAVSLVERPRACLVHPSPRCEETARESLELFEQLGEPSRAALSRVLLAVQGVTGADRERNERLLAEAQEQFEKDGEPWGSAVIGFVRMETALKTGDEDNAIPIGRATASLFRQLDDPWGLSAILYHLGWGLRQFGRYEESARVLEEAIDVAAAAGIWNTVQWALADLGVGQLHLGNQAVAEDLFERAAAASQQVGDGAGEVLATFGRALIAQINGDWIAARRGYDEARPGFAGLLTPVPEGLALAGLARCDEADGDPQGAHARYEQALAAGRAVGEPGLVATALEGLARVASARGDSGEARRLMGEAMSVRATSARPAPPHELRDNEAIASLVTP